MEDRSSNYRKDQILTDYCLASDAGHTLTSVFVPNKRNECNHEADRSGD